MERSPIELAPPTPEENYQGLKTLNYEHMAGMQLERPDGSPITFPDGTPVYGYNFLDFCKPARMALHNFAQLSLDDPRRPHLYEGMQAAVAAVIKIVPKPGEA